MSYYDLLPSRVRRSVPPSNFLSSNYDGAYCLESLLLDSNLAFRLDPLQRHRDRRWIEKIVDGDDTTAGSPPSPPSAATEWKEASTVNHSYVKSFTMLQTLEGHRGCVNSIHLDTTGELLVSGSDDLQVCVYDTTHHTLLRQYPTRHRSNIFHASFVPHHRERILTCALDGAVYLMDTETGEHDQKLSRSPMASDVVTSAASPHVAYVAYSDGYIARVDTRCWVGLVSGGTPLTGMVDSVCALAHHPLHSYTLASATNTPYVFLHDIRMGALSAFAALAVLGGHRRGEAWGKTHAEPGGLSFSERGDWLAVNYRDDDVYLTPWEGNLLSRNGSGVEVPHLVGAVGETVPVVACGGSRRLRGRTNVMTMFKQVAWMERDTVVCTGGDDGKVYFWDTGSGELLHSTRGDNDVVNGVLCHPQGRLLYACGIDNTVKVLGVPEKVAPHAAEGATSTSTTVGAAEEAARRPSFPDLVRFSTMEAADFVQLLSLLNGPSWEGGEEEEASSGSDPRDDDEEEGMSDRDSQRHSRDSGEERASSSMTSLAPPSSSGESGVLGVAPALPEYITSIAKMKLFAGKRLAVTRFNCTMVSQLREHTTLKQATIIKKQLMLRIHGNTSMYHSRFRSDSDNDDDDFDGADGGSFSTDSTDSDALERDISLLEEEEEEEEEAPEVETDSAVEEEEQWEEVESEDEEEEREEGESFGWNEVLGAVTNLFSLPTDSESTEDSSERIDTELVEDEEEGTGDVEGSTEDSAVLNTVASFIRTTYASEKSRYTVKAFHSFFDLLSQLLEGLTRRWIVPVAFADRDGVSGRRVVQHFKYNQCQVGNFYRMEKWVKRTLEGLSAEEQEQRYPELQAQFSACCRYKAKIHTLLDIIDLFLTQQETLFMTWWEKRKYWSRVAWLYLQYTFFFMAIGDLESAMQYCVQLDTWTEFAGNLALASAPPVSILPDGKDSTRKRSRPGEAPSPVDYRLWRCVSGPEKMFSKFRSPQWYPPLLVPLFLQYRILCFQCGEGATPVRREGTPASDRSSLQPGATVSQLGLPLPRYGVRVEDYTPSLEWSPPPIKNLLSQRDQCLHELLHRLESHPSKSIRSWMLEYFNSGDGETKESSTD